MSAAFPSKEELLKELQATVEGAFANSTNKVKKKAEEVKTKYLAKVSELCRSVSL
ncbi:hypothetical protein [Ignicoccus hospitalis]|uniref:Uncharacterized protein n=1 Tax=Ignicoccus hospitalis (strain KIN4/I / DSM 18386 / JCM 14125) TaxID=453591 RepID=A8AAB1_IGNH4|nr:hypothetical protein [Ignicoccus hospitalis]ABU81863.1 hypothetical protein Igni_0681 [Ignicoccus hospitalis KIN4/I]HIH90131.1 hypothetical protein [Desulfurococcaceae archaeon]